MIFFLLTLNFAISWWNARVAGLCWVESRVLGGWMRLMVWMAAVMSACGFSSCILIVAVLGFHEFGWVPDHVLKHAMELGFVLIVPLIVASGFLITVDSWAQAFRRGGVLNYGVATWNTYAQIHNTYEAIQGMGPALESLGEFFGEAFSGGSSSEDDAKGKAALLVIAIAVGSILAGVILTAVIIRSNAATVPLPEQVTLEQSRA